MTDEHEFKLRPEMRDLGGRLVNIHVYSGPLGNRFHLGKWKIEV